MESIFCLTGEERAATNETEVTEGKNMEIWRRIEGTKYEVSSWGRIRNSESGTIIKPYRNSKGYLKVGLMVEGKNKKYRVNRLVAMAFIPNPYNLPQVNHKDGNKENNSFTNLEWITNDDNAKHRQLMRKGVLL